MFSSHQPYIDNFNFGINGGFLHWKDHIEVASRKLSIEN